MVKWLGDGLMVAFASALDALRAAIAMQQSSRRPVSGERLSIRVDLNAGEALRDAADHFGTSVVVARRLCDRAEGGQILCAETVAGLLAGRSGFTFSRPIFNVLQAQGTLATALDEGLEDVLAAFAPLTLTVIPALAWGMGFMYGACACAAARIGDEQLALKYLGLLVPWLERAPAWHVGFPIFACEAAETIWRLERLEHAHVIEYAVREKVIKPDFRGPMGDGRLALARLCALQSRHDEAQRWLGESRRVLEEQRALPLLAIADFDEALMFARRGGPRDTERASHTLDDACRQFIELGMTGLAAPGCRAARPAGLAG